MPPTLDARASHLRALFCALFCAIFRPTFRALRPASHRIPHRIPYRILCRALCGALALPLGPAAVAQAVPEGEPLAALEREFWICDHAAAQSLLDPGTSERCGAVTEALKTTRFGGDFHALLRWWRDHKDARHAALTNAAPRRLARGPAPKPVD